MSLQTFSVPFFQEPIISHIWFQMSYKINAWQKKKKQPKTKTKTKTKNELSCHIESYA